MPITYLYVNTQRHNIHENCLAISDRSKKSMNGTRLEKRRHGFAWTDKYRQEAFLIPIYQNYYQPEV